MMKFQDWLGDDPVLMAEDNPAVAQQQQGTLIGQLFGWDSHGDPKTFGGKVANWWQGGMHRKAQEMGTQILRLRGRPDAADQATAMAQRDGVYDQSAFAHVLASIDEISDTFTGANVSGNAKFKSFLLFNILAKCHNNMRIEYNHIRSLYHAVMGTNPNAEPHLIHLWEPDQDPKTFYHPKVVSGGVSPMANPGEYNGDAAHGMYGHILASQIVSPYNLLLTIINAVPDKTLTPPGNMAEIKGQSLEFCRAYFPDFIWRKTKGSGSSGSGGGGGANTVRDFIDILNSITTWGFSDAKSGAKQRSMVDAAMRKVLGPTGTYHPEKGSPIDKLVDHNSFFGMQQIVEQSRLQ